MENAESYVLIVAGVLILSEMLAAILPPGNMKPFVKAAIGIMVMTVIIYPVAGCDTAKLFDGAKQYSAQETADAGQYARYIEGLYGSFADNG